MSTTEHRATITMAGYGRDPRRGEQLLEAFIATAPAAGAAIAQDVPADTISATFTVVAGGLVEAASYAASMFGAALAHSGFNPVIGLDNRLGIEIEVVDARELTTA